MTDVISSLFLSAQDFRVLPDEEVLEALSQQAVAGYGDLSGGD